MEKAAILKWSFEMQQNFSSSVRLLIKVRNKCLNPSKCIAYMRSAEDYPKL